MPVVAETASGENVTPTPAGAAVAATGTGRAAPEMDVAASDAVGASEFTVSVGGAAAEEWLSCAPAAMMASECATATAAAGGDIDGGDKVEVAEAET
jgi:hypothetical protein